MGKKIIRIDICSLVFLIFEPQVIYKLTSHGSGNKAKRNCQQNHKEGEKPTCSSCLPLASMDLKCLSTLIS